VSVGEVPVWRMYLGVGSSKRLAPSARRSAGIASVDMTISVSIVTGSA